MTRHEDAGELLATAIEAAQAAGRLVHGRIGDDLKIRHKELGVQNLVTEMDHASEALIKEIIGTRHPGAIFLAEESGGDQTLEELTWVVDPIDGTVNYAHGIPIYCISIAAVRENEPVVGVIYNPNTEELFTAVRGGGAFLNGVPMRVSTIDNLRRAVLVTGFPYNVAENPYGCVDSFVDFMMLGVPVRRLGSAALDLAYTAAGRFEAFWEVSLNHWDVAAGILMVIEAGGRVTTYAEACSDERDEACPIVTDRMLATNGVIHRTIETVLMRSGTVTLD
ncbi:MAG TPA: inositol monophosphatase family protein [Candidatus Kapabacteria bacterium]|jgi:myo-inositol-1(or 4)-monophosphatase|nr:inositol monophosphatase family protein [Candidatus Kapabacteria bacterium]